MSENSQAPHNSNRGHETTDADIGKIVRSGIVLFLVVVASLVAMRLMFSFFVERQGLGPPASPFENTRKLPPENMPRLQVAAPKDLGSYRLNQQKSLEEYGWVDRSNGVVRIPIDRAMDLLVERGLPVESGTSGQQNLQPGMVQQYTVPKGYAPAN